MSPAAPKTPPRYRLFLPYILLAIAMIIYSGIWFFTSVQLKKNILAQREFTTEKIAISGFPSQWRIDLKNTQYALSQGVVHSAKTYITQLVYKPSHHIFGAEGEQYFQDKNGHQLTMTSGTLQGSFVRSADRGNRLSVVIKSPVIMIEPFLGTPFNLQANKIEFYTRALPEKPNFSENILKFAALDMTKTLQLVNGEVAFIAAQTGLAEGIEFSKLWLRFADDKSEIVTLRAKGRLELDSQRYLQGKIDLQIVHLSAFLGILQQNRLISERDASTVMLFTNLASAASGDAQNTLSLPLQFRQGQMFLGPVMLGSAPQF